MKLYSPKAISLTEGDEVKWKDVFKAERIYRKEMYADKAIFAKNPELRKNKDFILAALKTNYLAFQEADPALQNDYEFILEAASIQFGILYGVEQNFLEDRNFALRLVEKNGLTLKQLSNFQDDPEIVLAAVKNKGAALKFADSIFQDDRNYVLEAIKNDGKALLHASPRLKKDRDLLLIALKTDPSAIFANPELINDPEVKKAFESHSQS